MQKFTDAAGREAWLDPNTGMVYTEGGKNPTHYTLDAWNERQLKKYGTPKDQTERENEALKKSLTKEIIKLDEKYDQLINLGLTENEKDQIMQKAIDEISGYYDIKMAQLTEGLAEGKLRTAEDTMLFIREVEQEMETLAAKYDVTEAQTEQEFVNKMASLTSKTEDELEAKKMQWQKKVEDVKFRNVQSGMLTSGIGRAEKARELAARDLDISSAERRASEAQTELETTRKFSLENIRLAREAAERKRTAQIGSPEETESLRASARETLGLGAGEDVGSVAEIEARRSQSGIAPVYDKYAPEELEAERSLAAESRRAELEAQTKAEKEQERAAELRKILRERESKQSKLYNLGGYAY